ncbi:MAG: metal ABC transporter ATPase [Cyanobacteriota bacterium]|nr:metal ABC transporter ATPase [Cyanobacteriota bacterium]
MTAATTYEVNPIQPEITQAQIGAFLQEHGEIETIAPVVLGILVTSRFQLRGANALLANLLIASLARQIFAQLKKQAPLQTVPRENNTADSSSTPSNLGGYEIAHSVPGRVRLRVPRLASDRAFAQRLETLLTSSDRVTHVRLNPAAASIAVEYNAEELSEWELGRDLLEILQAAASETDRE